MVLKVSVAGAVLVAFLVAFLTVRIGDETALRGTTAIITLWEAEPGDSRTTVGEAIATTARTEDITLYRSIAGFAGERPVRTVFVVNRGRDHGLASPARDYPDFGRSVETQFRRVSSLGADVSPLGMYVTGADSAHVRAFAAALRDQGMTVSVSGAGPVSLLLFAAGSVPLVPVAAAAMLVLAVGCVHAVSASRRKNALRRANGVSPDRIVAGQVATGVGMTSVFGLAAFALSIPALFLYNGLAQFGRFSLAAAVGVSAVAVAAAILLAITTALESRGRIVPSLGGRRPLRRLTAFGYAAHLTAVALVLVTLASVAVSGGSTLENRRDETAWKAASSYSSLTFRLSRSEFEVAEHDFATVGTRALSAGRALLVVRPTGPTRGYGPEEGNSLVVDSRYLDEQAVVDPSGRALRGRSIRPEALTLIVPERMRSQTSDLVREYRAWLRLQSELPGGVARPDDVAIDVLQSRSEQRLFTYETSAPTSALRDPVIAVVPETVRLLSDNWTASAMTQGMLLFDDQRSLRADLRSLGLGSSVVEHRISDLAAARRAEQEQHLRASTFAGLLAALIAVVAAVTLAGSIADRHRRRDFLRLSHGRSRVSTVVVPCLVITILGFALILAETAVGILPRRLGLPGGMAVIAGTAFVVGVSLVVYQRRALSVSRRDA